MVRAVGAGTRAATCRREWRAESAVSGAAVRCGDPVCASDRRVSQCGCNSDESVTVVDERRCDTANGAARRTPDPEAPGPGGAAARGTGSAST